MNSFVFREHHAFEPATEADKQLIQNVIACNRRTLEEFAAVINRPDMDIEDPPCFAKLGYGPDAPCLVIDGSNDLFKALYMHEVRRKVAELQPDAVSVCLPGYARWITNRPEGMSNEEARALVMSLERREVIFEYIETKSGASMVHGYSVHRENGVYRIEEEPELTHAGGTSEAWCNDFYDRKDEVQRRQ